MLVGVAGWVLTLKTKQQDFALKFFTPLQQ
jgi:hypothetical protein